MTPPDLDAIERGVITGERGALSRAITLIESGAEHHRALAQHLLDRLMPRTGRSMRVGITGAPGAGKSTFIECLGMMLVEHGHRVAVLAVDPSSDVTGGSILGDKTRMERLSVHPNAYVRPSPSGGALGGVASKTRETMLACEAAGFDVVLVETVGVGQSETAVADMTDFYLALMIPGAGDELQGIKRGLLELADMVAVNKADDHNVTEARHAVAAYTAAVRIAPRDDPEWDVPVVSCSARTGAGVPELWKTIEERLRVLRSDGRLDERRRRQMLRWMWTTVDELLLAYARQGERIEAQRRSAVDRVMHAKVLPPIAGRELVEALLHSSSSTATHNPHDQHDTVPTAYPPGGGP
ncbi:MAG: methylmalonyl Co-A mutase-associated GTPase MeaB [Phycisphaerales bacterium]